MPLAKLPPDLLPCEIVVSYVLVIANSSQIFAGWGVSFLRSDEKVKGSGRSREVVLVGPKENQVLGEQYHSHSRLLVISEIDSTSNLNTT